jgi:hypothetical protein
MSLDIFLAPGESLDVTAVLRNHAGGVVVQRVVDAWTSSDQLKATVTKTGDRTARITGVASSGTCTIRAFLTSGPGSPLSSSICTVHCQAAPVDPAAPHAILLSLSSVPLGDGETVDITATILDQNGDVVAGRVIDSWTTADGTIATVASTGGLTARVTGHGTSGNPTNIIAHITSGSGSPLASDPLVVSNRGAGITATGGTITDVDGCRVHTFSADGTFQITAGAGDVEILVVGGGGSGADVNGTGVGGGGGGGGETVHLTQHLGVGSYAVTIGAGAPHGLGTASQNGQDGGNSTFNGSSLLTGRGGGGGACLPPGARNGRPGGSGGGAGGVMDGSTPSTGGASTAVAPGMGNAGGDGDAPSSNGTGGGGGGASAAGDSGVLGGAGGDGFFSSITGTLAEYARGGDGGLATAVPQGGTVGVDGVDGTGNGGGGGGHGTGAHGGAGGKGVVIVRYALPTGTFGAGSNAATGGTVTDISGWRVHTFTADAIFNLTSGNDDIEYLIVGGGGAGGSKLGPDSYAAGGGGGAGGVRTGTLRLALGNFNVVVGPGGVGAKSAPGAKGTDSSFAGVIAKGGGGGGCTPDGNVNGNRAGTSGGSGGGGGSQGGFVGFGSVSAGGLGTAGGGHDGGMGTNDMRGGGGGGATAAGELGSTGAGATPTSGFGGKGLLSDIDGTAKYYGGGGGGAGRIGNNGPGQGGKGGGGKGGQYAGTGPDSGTANTGGGGGGGASNQVAGSGGKGIVILRYRH